MPGANFFDSNVLLYLADPNLKKAIHARSLLTLGGVISVQVLNEYASVAQRKFQHSWDLIAYTIEGFREALTVEPVTIADHELARRISERHKLSFYDAVIAASALNAGCERLWTEDLHHGLVLDGRLTIENPFREI